MSPLKRHGPPEFISVPFVSSPFLIRNNPPLLVVAAVIVVAPVLVLAAVVFVLVVVALVVVAVLSLSPLYSSLSIEALPVLFPQVLSLSLSIYLNVCLYISLSPFNPVLCFRSRISFLLSLEIHAIRSTQTGPHRLTPAQI